MSERPWAREYRCGCRDVLRNGFATTSGDECKRHGEPVVVAGYLTDEETAEDLLLALEAIRDTCPCDPDITERWEQAWTDMLAAIAKARGTDE